MLKNISDVKRLTPISKYRIFIILKGYKLVVEVVIGYEKGILCF